ncbi:MAG TPA: thiamine pyrophosphate-binding protein [Alphaproteobacteria bacterium]|nr:thiamine pyrophosphate-binding protein [Alphaproteobacteria bacterium]
MRVYEAIVKALEGIGVDAAFGGAGENAASLMLALKHATKIKPVIVRHEQAASFMACGYAIFSNRLGVCFATAGPGAFNLFSGLAVAMSDSYPVLAISGYASLEWRGMGALNETSGLSRTPNSQAMFGATTKRSYLLEDPAQTCDVLEEAVNLAFEGRPGPVHIHVPENLTHRGVSVDNYRDIRLNVRPVLPDSAEIDAAAGAIADALRKGKRIVTLIGYGAVRSGAGPALRTLVERYQIPFATTHDAKGILPEDHPLAVGILADSGHATAGKTLVEADLVIAVGNSFAQHDTFNFLPDLLKGKTLVHVNIDPHEIGKVYRAECPVASDAKPAVEQITSTLSISVDPVAPVQFEKDRHISASIVNLEPNHIHPGQMAQCLSRLLPDDSIVLADAGAHLAWLGYYLQLSPGQHYRKAGSFGPMAWAVNGALGAKLAHPERPVVVGCGDGGYLLSGFELMTAVQYNIPAIWIIFNDGEFKLIKLYQLETYGESGLVEFANPDYVAYARACGAQGYLVKSVAEFEAAFREALASGKPTVIDASITRLALPHYSPNPAGLLAAIEEAIAGKLRGG